MALLGKKTEEEEKTEDSPKQSPVVLTEKDVLVQPRLSEKAVGLDKLSKYVFTVKKAANKLEIRKALEKFYGIKIARVNVVNVQGKTRRYGKAIGKTKNFKKAIVTLTKDSKRPDILEAK